MAGRGLSLIICLFVSSLDLFAGEAVYGLDTGCGNGGFLSALELPALRVYESREAQGEEAVRVVASGS